jgi:hypothetical protein
MKKIFPVCVLMAVSAGLFIGWVDSRPTWDDTGITVIAIVLVTGFIGLINPAKAWLWALVVGLEISLFDILLTGNYGAIVAIPIAFAGAYLGAFIRKSSHSWKNNTSRRME